MKQYTDIPASVRIEVLERDSWDGCPCCILCGKPLNSSRAANAPNLHHLKGRGIGGKGIPQNLVTLCRACHTLYHNTRDPEMESFFKEYLKDKYPDWREEDLTV